MTTRNTSSVASDCPASRASVHARNSVPRPDHHAQLGVLLAARSRTPRPSPPTEQPSPDAATRQMESAQASFAGPARAACKPAISRRHPRPGTAISADGSVIAGISDQARALCWTAASGLQSIAVPASTAYGMSADGRAIVGYGGMYGGVFRWSVASGYENLDGNRRPAPRHGGTQPSADGSAVVGFTEARATVWA